MGSRGKINGHLMKY